MYFNRNFHPQRSLVEDFHCVLPLLSFCCRVMHMILQTKMVKGVGGRALSLDGTTLA